MLVAVIMRAMVVVAMLARSLIMCLIIVPMLMVAVPMVVMRLVAVSLIAVFLILSATALAFGPARALMTVFVPVFLVMTFGVRQQTFAVGDGDLIIVRVDFAEGQKAMTVAAIFDEGGLQRRFYARDLGEIDISTQLLALGGLEIKFFDSIAADDDDPGLFRVGRIDQHFVGHFGTLGGGGRVLRQARMARPGDATVHLIRG